MPRATGFVEISSQWNLLQTVSSRENHDPCMLCGRTDGDYKVDCFISFPQIHNLISIKYCFLRYTATSL